MTAIAFGHGLTIAILVIGMGHIRFVCDYGLLAVNWLIQRRSLQSGSHIGHCNQSQDSNLKCYIVRDCSTIRWMYWWIISSSKCILWLLCNNRCLGCTTRQTILCNYWRCNYGTDNWNHMDSCNSFHTLLLFNCVLLSRQLYAKFFSPMYWWVQYWLQQLIVTIICWHR